MRAGIVALLLAALPGCGQILIDEYPYAAVDAGAPDTPIAWVSAACASCTASSCDAARAACESTSACRPTLACIAGCAANDPYCRYECEARFGSSPQFTALDNCRRTECLNECIGRSISGAFDAPNCACIDVQCPDLVAECVTSPGERIGDCERKVACARKLGSHPDAMIRCLYQNKDGEDALIALRTCWASTTCNSCEVVGGRVMGCALDYRWQAPVAKTAAVTLTITRFGTKVGVPGMRVRALLPQRCPLGGESVDEGTTGADGKVTLAKLPIDPRGFNGCFEVTSPTHVPTVLYAGHPISTDETQLNGSVITPDELVVATAIAELTVEKGTAALAVGAYDCLFTRASGVSIDINDEAKLPTTARAYANPLLETTLEVTTSHGAAAFVNVKPGPVTVTMHSRGRLVGSQRIYARPDEVTGLILLPGPKD